MVKQLAAVLVALSGMSGMTALPAAAHQVSQQDLAAILRSGALDARHQAARDVLQIPVDQRDEALMVTMANELERVVAESHARIDALNAGADVPSLGADHGDYYRDLVDAVSHWDDRRGLRPLLSVAGTGMLATRGILRFGEAAVPPLIDAARTAHSSETGGVLHALSILLEGFPVAPYNIPPTALSPVARRQITQLARDLLAQAGTSGSSDLPMIAGLALATGDDGLRGQVELLAREPGLVAQFTGLGDPVTIGLVQNGIRTRLDRHKR
jgi:hypothetical protein